MKTIKDKNDIQKIGVIMFGLLGDVLVRTPVLKALSEIYTKASIIGITDSSMKATLENNPYLDKLILIDKTNKNKFQKNIDKFKGISKVNNEKFDLLIDLYNGGLSRLIVAFSGARYRLGFNNAKHSFLYNITTDFLPDTTKEVLSINFIAMSILRPLSNKSFLLKPIFEILDEDIAFASNYFKNMEIDTSRLYTLNLASGGEDKIMNQKLSYMMVECIYKEYGYYPMIVSNPSQEYIQTNFINDYLIESGIPFIQLDTVSLNKIAALMKMTQFIITPDTGLMHIAMAMDMYIYTVFTYSNPETVESKGEKFICAYEGFEKGRRYQAQNISFHQLEEKIHHLFEKLN